MPTVEVRCCCDANRLMGDMEVARVEQEGILWWWDNGQTAVALRWGLMKYGTGHIAHGLISNGVSLETLLTIPQFTARSEE